MNVENINKYGLNPRILVAPLDWGLGHTTRCIPLIYELLAQHFEVILAAEKNAAELLKKEFPALQILPIRGYRISYSRNKRLFFLKMLSQVPKIMAVISYEKRWLKQIIKDYKINVVISDNRFGLQNAAIHSIYITHQLHIETGNEKFNKIAQQIHYRFINRFNECWVPDAPGEINLAGRLSHPRLMPNIAVKYLGYLSRFKKREFAIENDLLIMLSGPEPQRSIFESMLLRQLKDFDSTVVLARGLPSEKKEMVIENKKVKIFNHLPSAELSRLIQQSRMVLARAGYSTIMDLVALEKNAVLVPTPGQAEQEYLAKYLMEEKMFFSVPQQNFELKNVLDGVAQFKFSPVTGLAGSLEQNISDLFESIKPQA